MRYSIFQSMPVIKCCKIITIITHVIGSANVLVKHGQEEVGTLPVTIKAGRRLTLLGLDRLKHIKLDWYNILKVANDKGSDSLSETLSKYSADFQEGSCIGTVKNTTATLVLKSDATPRFYAPRPIPFALKASVEEEIHELEAEGTWQRVDYSDWGTPLVPIAKKDGAIRLCGDYKVTVNRELQVAQHPLPNPGDMFAALGGCKLFSKLDLKQAFQQLQLDEKSQEICTLNIHLETFPSTEIAVWHSK